MSKGNGFETALLELVLTNAALAGIGDAAGLQPSATPGELFVSLHTADPGEAGTQATSEATFTGYARVGVARDGSGWTVAAGSAQNAADVEFAECTAGTETITHFALGTDETGGGQLLYRGALTDPVDIEPGMFPRFPAGALSISED